MSHRDDAELLERLRRRMSGIEQYVPSRPPRLVRAGTTVRVASGTQPSRLAILASVVGLAVLAGVLTFLVPRLVQRAASDPAVSPSASTVPERLTRIDRVTLSDDGLVLRVEFVGGPPYDPLDACSVDYGARTEVRGDSLDVAVFEVDRPGQVPLLPFQGCPAAGVRRAIEVELAEPFHGSRVRDLAGGEHTVAQSSPPPPPSQTPPPPASSTPDEADGPCDVPARINEERGPPANAYLGPLDGEQPGSALNMSWDGNDETLNDELAVPAVMGELAPGTRLRFYLAGAVSFDTLIAETWPTDEYLDGGGWRSASSLLVGFEESTERAFCFSAPEEDGDRVIVVRVDFADSRGSARYVWRWHFGPTPPATPTPIASPTPAPLVWTAPLPFVRLVVDEKPGMLLAGVQLLAGTTTEGLTTRLSFPLPDVPPERRGVAGPFVDGPHDGEVLLGLDDGQRSRLYLVRTADGSYEEILSLPEVIMHAAYDATAGRVYFVQVDRGSMDEDGIWRYDIGSSDPVMIRSPQRDPSDNALATPYERLRLTPDRTRLLVQRRSTFLGRGGDWYQVISTVDGSVSELDDPLPTGDFSGLNDQFAAYATFVEGCAYQLLELNTLASRCVDAPPGEAELVEIGGEPVLVINPSLAPRNELLVVDIETGEARPLWNGERGFYLAHQTDEERIVVPDGMVMVTSSRVGSLQPLFRSDRGEALLIDVRTGSALDLTLDRAP